MADRSAVGSFADPSNAQALVHGEIASMLLIVPEWWRSICRTGDGIVSMPGQFHARGKPEQAAAHLKRRPGYGSVHRAGRRRVARYGKIHECCGGYYLNGGLIS